MSQGVTIGAVRWWLVRRSALWCDWCECMLGVDAFHERFWYRTCTSGAHARVALHANVGTHKEHEGIDAPTHIRLLRRYSPPHLLACRRHQHRPQAAAWHRPGSRPREGFAPRPAAAGRVGQNSVRFQKPQSQFHKPSCPTWTAQEGGLTPVFTTSYNHWSYAYVTIIHIHNCSFLLPQQRAALVAAY